MKRWAGAGFLLAVLAGSAAAQLPDSRTVTIPGLPVPCREIKSAHSEPGEWTFTGRELENLVEAHARLSGAADRAPVLLLCESRIVNAFAIPDDGDGRVGVFTWRSQSRKDWPSQDWRV